MPLSRDVVPSNVLLDGPPVLHGKGGLGLGTPSQNGQLIVTRNTLPNGTITDPMRPPFLPNNMFAAMLPSARWL